MKKLIHEIHRRSLWQVLGIYLAGSWVALQVVEQLASAASLPDWVQPLALALLIIGFPIVMATAFVQHGFGGHGPANAEGAPSPAGFPGVPAAGAPSDAVRLFTWRNAALGGVGAFALWGLVAAVLLLSGTGRGGASSATPDDGRITIAVLPFASAGSDEQSRVFSMGIHDDLLTRLSKIGSLRVTSRTSVQEYRETTKNLPQIADELGVSYVLEGSVLSSGGQININAQLIDAAADDHLWAETYNRSLTVTNVFAIQKELAQRITASLSAALLPDEVAAVETPPTEDLEAYNFFLRGHAYFQEGPRSEDFDLAIQMYERAVAIDPGFAEAHARLSLARGMKYEVQPFGDPELLEGARAAAERAFELAPDLPETNLAFGQYYYTGERNLDLALEHLTRAGQETFRNADLFHLLGAVQRRKADLAGSVASFEELVRLDPLSAHYLDDLGSTYAAAARWQDAERALRRSIDLSPRAATPYVWLAEVRMAQGDLEGARAALDEREDEGEISYWRWQLDLLSGDLDRATTRDVGLFERAFALDLKGDRRAGRPLLDSLMIQYADGEPSADQPLRHAEFGWVYAALGRRDDALREANRAVELSPVSADFLEGPELLWWKALTLVRLGETDGALETLDSLVSNKPPGHYTAPYLRLHPGLDPLREDPRFEALLATAGSPGKSGV